MSEKIPILYHQNGIAIISKRFGLASQPTRKGEENLYSLLQKQFPYVGLHHRLDTPASGLILITTDKKHNKNIAEAFQQRNIQRHYLLAVIGKTRDHGCWNGNIEGKKAKTNWKKKAYREGFSILEASLETGRKHQIRRHAVQAGHPIIGDRRYGGSAGRLSKRLVLHAHRLVFTHPHNNELVTVESPLPQALLPFLNIP